MLLRLGQDQACVGECHKAWSSVIGFSEAHTSKQGPFCSEEWPALLSWHLPWGGGVVNLSFPNLLDSGSVASWGTFSSHFSLGLLFPKLLEREKQGRAHLAQGAGGPGHSPLPVAHLPACASLQPSRSTS